jgi:hypothetical protein
MDHAGVQRRIRIGAVVAVLAVGLSIPVIRTYLEPITYSSLTETSFNLQPAIVYNVEYADTRHGYALWGRCRPNGADCERKLLVSEDGNSWTRRSFDDPRLASPAKLDGRLVSLGGGRLVLSDMAAGRFRTTDGGRIWQEIPSTPEQMLTSLPPDGILEAACTESVSDPSLCRRRRLMVTLPDTGLRAWLATPPPLGRVWPEPRRTPDGGWWVTGLDRATGNWGVAVSRDDGRSWTVTFLPAVNRVGFDRITLAWSNSAVYALATGLVANVAEPRSLLGIFRSADGGSSWEQTWVGDGRQPRSLGGVGVVWQDGSLVVSPADIGPGYKSVDGGRTFSAMLDGPRVGVVKKSGGGYVGELGGKYFRSLDGVGWTGVSVR